METQLIILAAGSIICFNMEITNSTLSENLADEGGGIYNQFNLQITNSTLYGNSASSDGWRDIEY
jgi:hypothetical protein